MEKRLQPGDLSDSFAPYIWGDQMENGKRYRSRIVVGEFKKENGQVYFKSPMADSEWIKVNPSGGSMFREVV